MREQLTPTNNTMKTLCAFLAIVGLLVAIPSTASARNPHHHPGYVYRGYGHSHGGVRLGIGVGPYYVDPVYPDPYPVEPYYGGTTYYDGSYDDAPGFYYWSNGRRYYRSGGGGHSHGHSHSDGHDHHHH